jgi:hypothetical protein
MCGSLRCDADHVAEIQCGDLLPNRSCPTPPGVTRSEARQNPVDVISARTPACAVRPPSTPAFCCQLCASRWYPRGAEHCRRDHVTLLPGSPYPRGAARGGSGWHERTSVPRKTVQRERGDRTARSADPDHRGLHRPPSRGFVAGPRPQNRSCRDRGLALEHAFCV